MTIQTVIDTQYGSTGKGAVCAKLAIDSGVTAAVTAFGPNAGHTFYDQNGNKHVHNMLACAVASPTLDRIYIGPGSIVDVDRLVQEISNAEQYGLIHAHLRIYIHETAVLLQQHHSRIEQDTLARIGSTMKGTGAAIADKIFRNPEAVVGNERDSIEERLWPYAAILSNSHYRECLGDEDNLLVEGAQGHSLGINHGFYPHCTSRDCTSLAVANECGLNMHQVRSMNVIGVARTFPIRVANRYDEDGNQIGTSGGCYPDQWELDWDQDLGLEPELTTVTKLPRRIFSFSVQQVQESIVASGIHQLALTFCDYLSDSDRRNFMIVLAKACAENGCELLMASDGPKLEDYRYIADEGEMS